MIEEIDVRDFVFHTEGHPAPGCMVTATWDDQCLGTVLASVKEVVTVIWSRPPRLGRAERTMTREMREQIAQEIDREIINDLVNSVERVIDK